MRDTIRVVIALVLSLPLAKAVFGSTFGYTSVRAVFAMGFFAGLLWVLASRVSTAVHGPPTPAPPARPDAMRLAIYRTRDEVDAALTDRATYASSIEPRLRTLAIERLRARHGLTTSDAPAKVRAAAGNTVAALVRGDADRADSTDSADSADRAPRMQRRRPAESTAKELATLLDEMERM